MGIISIIVGRRGAHLSPDYMATAVGKLDGIMGGMVGKNLLVSAT